MKRILVPLDGTRNAEVAITAMEPFCDPDDEVVLLRVERPRDAQRGGFLPSAAVMDAVGGPATGGAPLAPPDVPYYLETEDQATQTQLDEAKDYLQRFVPDLRARSQRVRTEVLIADDPKEAIVHYAREMRPTFIVLVRRTHPALAETIFGSVASNVMKADVAPVLLVPPPDET